MVIKLRFSLFNWKVRAGPFFDTQASGVPQPYGAGWDVQAIGPEGLPGVWGMGYHTYNVHGTKPQPKVHYAKFNEGDPVRVGWSTNLAPGGWFQIVVRYGGCNGPISGVHVFRVPSVGSSHIDLTGLEFNKEYSWFVTPLHYSAYPV